MSMKTIIFFIIAIVNVISYFGDDKCCKQCCEHCCEYLKIFCNKEKKKVGNNGEEENENNEEEGEGEDENSKKEEEEEKEDDENSKEEEEEKKEEDENNEEEKDKNEVQEEAKNLVNKDWLNSKNNIVLKIFNKDETKNEYKSGSIKINLVKEYGKTKIAKLEKMGKKLKTWALFKIIYKKEGNKEEETKYLYCSDIGSINCYGIFDHCQQHVSISVIACNTSKVTDMHHMFSGCTALSKLCLSNFDTKFDTSNVSTMNNMFSKCNSLQTLDLSNFNTNKVTNMKFMFSECKALQTLDLSNFNTNNVTNMKFMFSECKALQTLDLSNFNTSKIIYMKFMFSECKALQTITSHNKNLDKKIIEQLKKLGFKDEPQQKEYNKFVWEKQPNQ